MISIITCIHNQETRLFRECAASVMKQSGQVEWLIVDDGSDVEYADSLNQVLEQVGGTHYVELITFPKNRGLSFSRNAALKRVRGEWVVVLDSDDAIASSLTQDLERIPKSQKVACFAVDYLKLDGSVEHRSVKRWGSLYFKYGLTPRDPFLWFDFYYHGLMARTELIIGIGGYQDHLKVGEDQDILLRACEYISVNQVEFVDRVGYRYRDNPKGVCRQRWSEVEKNYTASMVEGAQRRGARVDACKLVGTRNVDGVDIDEYQYRSKSVWHCWEEADSWSLN